MRFCPDITLISGCSEIDASDNLTLGLRRPLDLFSLAAWWRSLSGEKNLTGMNYLVKLTHHVATTAAITRNLRELRMETVQLDQHAKEMENRLEELRQRMNQEKEEREKMGASHWRSAQPGVQSVRTNKENSPHRLSPGKMKIRVLKDEPVPVQKQVIAEPAAKVYGTNRKLNLRGKVCGQCEVQLAGLAELQTPVSTRDVLGRLQQQVLFVNDGVDVEDEEAGEEEDSSLLRGGFDEEESARGQIEEFQPQSVVQSQPEPPTPPPAEMDELSRKLTDSEEETTGEDSCLVPSEEDSSDEELRRITDAGEERNGFASPCPTMTPPADPHFTFTKSEHDNTESDLFTGSSKALHSVAQRQGIQLGQYQDLEGILTLGLDPGVLQPNPAPAQTSREENHTGNSLVVGQESWRSFSSLQHHAEEELVAALMNGRPVSSTPRPFTPGRSRMSSQRLCFSGTVNRCSPITSRPLSAGTSRPDPTSQPLSRAAQEIMEVQTVEQLDLQDSDEDEEDFLALACLEEEFRNMSTTPLDEGEDGHIPVD
ncbi:zinc finger B-box domain-containing 1-like protein [Labeo rohita]|uniref:Zinc finger B-box domain-containing 1-like protein n=1 Tax=Labeo rohita TaxID=84645 RepID=A0A498LUQ6_LABRO|nr:zinc finger B-box domain-containing 1-like protein [Labeo rohita]